MTLGEIKLETLRIMFANNTDTIVEENLPTYYVDEQYKSYLNAMVGSINRCFTDIENKGYSNIGVVEIQPTVSGGYRYAIPQDCISIEQVLYCEEEIEYEVQGQYLILPESDTCILVYQKAIERITSTTSDDTEIDLPNNIANLIPYYVKGDIYREDEPNEASESRNWYEAGMSQVRPINTQKKVESIYRL